jgi:hypothetical protein
MRERVEHSNNSAHHNSRAKSICKEKEQQKPLTLYGIGLINQIMDFTSFDSKQLSFDSFLSISRSFGARLNVFGRNSLLSLAPSLRRQHEIFNKNMNLFIFYSLAVLPLPLLLNF